MKEKYLPIGSVITLSDMDVKLMIVGYLVKTAEDDKEVFDYTACLYPQGFFSSEGYILFNHKDIEKIWFIGYQDEDYEEYHKYLNEIDVDEESNQEDLSEKVENTKE